MAEPAEFYVVRSRALDLNGDLSSRVIEAFGHWEDEGVFSAFATAMAAAGRHLDAGKGIRIVRCRETVVLALEPGRFEQVTDAGRTYVESPASDA